MSTSIRLAACVEWKQLDDNKKPVTEVRFKTDEEKEFLKAWKSLFDTLAYQYDAPEEILLAMVRDCVKWRHSRDVYGSGKVPNEYQLGCPQELIDYLNVNQSVVEPVFRPVIKSEPLKYYAQ